ncbi:hypothetical protein [Pontibaca methylaminivorans]|uniref:hypothetical protein n=1 Tax=Pontibaca methylaminivorans TaxID=515897 RepID=UPI002FDB0D6D
MRAALILTCFTLAACGAEPEPESKPGSRARFDSYPHLLFTAVEMACSSPAQHFQRPERDRVECREYLPPEPTAALILMHDGTPEDLPQVVMRFDTRAEASGWLVENDLFVNVPRRGTTALELRDAEAPPRRTLHRLYRDAGGRPE